MTCSFTTLDDLPKRGRDADTVLAFLRDNGIQRVSAFEMTTGLWGTLTRLEGAGRITMAKENYPWIRVTVQRRR